ncbi:MAG TPA: hypothetical protein VMK30_01705 [Pleomorphomonadaceae bacterium]|nr:hypothetical protein [Pleomorphomonadaceae bacterium]
MTVSAQTPARHATRLTLALAAIAGLTLAAFYAASPVFADHTDGPLVDPDTTTYSEPGDNPDCQDLVDDGLIDSFDEEEKFDPADSGTQGNVTFTNDDEVGSFEAADGWLVTAVIVKGGSGGANVYNYSGFTGGGVDHDNGLIVPTGQEISHITFCLVEAPEETPTPTPEGSEAGGTGTPDPSKTPEGSQLGGTGTPAASLLNTAIGLPGSGSLATIFFGAILIASLGALAYANVTAVRRRS